MAWTDERVEQLKHLYLVEKLSSGQIAKQMGGGMTRNGVIGKVHRIGLEKRGRTGGTNPNPRPRVPKLIRYAGQELPPKPKPGKLGSHNIGYYRNTTPDDATLGASRAEFEQAMERSGAAPDEIEAAMAVNRCSLAELTTESCRWPVGHPGEPGFFFCGGAAITTLPYCAYHSRVAYSPPTVRRDRSYFR